MTKSTRIPSPVKHEELLGQEGTSQLIGLALADVLDGSYVHPLVFRTIVKLLDHLFLGDWPPETPFYGRHFLLTQLLVMYVQDRVRLSGSGQTALAPGCRRVEGMAEALDFLEEDLERLASPKCQEHYTIGRLLYGLVVSGDAVGYVRALRTPVLEEKIPFDELRRLIFVVLLIMSTDQLSMGESKERLKALKAAGARCQARLL